MIAILTTHPIQYQVPLWQALAEDGRVPFEVWYMTAHGTTPSHDPEFGKTFAWDLDALSGYQHRFLDVVPGATPNSFLGCRLAESLERRLRDSGVSALWVQGWQVAGYWQAVRAARRVGIQVWLRGESNAMAPVSPAKAIVKRTVLGRLFKAVDHFFYIGTANRLLYEQFGVTASQLHPAPYAVDNARFEQQGRALRPERAAIRRAWGIPEGALCVLFCGKLIPKKRPQDIVAAADLLQKRGERPVHLLFAGTGELGADLRRSCAVVFDAEHASNPGSVPQADTRPRASFCSFLNQSEVAKAYVAADCLVLPSDYGETWGLVVNEAMACGTPCIVSDRCGCAPDLGVFPPNAIYACGDVASLAQLIEAVRKAEQRPPAPPSLLATVDAVASLWAQLR